MSIQTLTRPERKHAILRKITAKIHVFQLRHLGVDPHHVDALTAVLSNGKAVRSGDDNAVQTLICGAISFSLKPK